MSTHEALTIEAATREEAVARAFEKLGINDERDALIEVLEEGERRNMLFQKKNFIKIRVTPLRRLASDQVEKALHDFMRSVVTQCDVASDVEVTEGEEGKLQVDLQEMSCESLQQSREVLDALQHIASRFLIRQGAPRRVSVDAADVRDRRESEIETLIKTIHEQTQTGKTFTTDPLSSFERRKVHLGLEALGGVRTVSVGRGVKKRVVAYPRRRRGSERASQDAVSNPETVPPNL